MDETCILKADSFKIFCMMIFPESLRASDEVSGPIFCKLFHVYIYRLLPSVYMSQMGNVFSMSFMCL